MAKPQVDPIPILPLGMVNAFLLTQGASAVLVDTGLPGSESRVHSALARRGLDWSNLKLIVVTHSHIDHAGSAARMRALSHAPILAHRLDVPYLEGAPQDFRPTGFVGRVLRASGLITQHYAAFTPDLILSDSQVDLRDFGLSARVIHTPGHTPGSLSVLAEGGDVIAADLVSSGVFLGGIALRNRPKPPPFEENRDQAKASLRHLLARGGQRFHLGHGGPLDATRIRAYAG